MKKGLLSAIFLTAITGLYAQVEYPTSVTETKVTSSFASQVNSDSMQTKVMVNMEMIQRFRNVQTEGDIYSWSQLLADFNSANVQELVYAYRTSNLGEQSLESIKLAMEQKIQENSVNTNQNPDDYYGNIERIKREINAKLGGGNSVAMK